MTSPFTIVRLRGEILGATKPQQADVSAIVKKSDRRTSAYAAANEIICAKLGSYIGLPIPPGVLAVDKNDKKQVYYASLDFAGDGTRLPDIFPKECCREFTHLSTGILLFDIWVLNPDRNKGNIYRNDRSTKTRLWVFDHSHALFGTVAGEGSLRLGQNRTSLGIGNTTSSNDHCLCAVLETSAHFQEWYARIAGVPAHLIKAACEEAKADGAGLNDVDVERAVEVLTYRQRKLPDIVSNNRVAFKRIADWGPLT